MGWAGGERDVLWVTNEAAIDHVHPLIPVGETVCPQGQLG